MATLTRADKEILQRANERALRGEDLPLKELHQLLLIVDDLLDQIDDLKDVADER